MQTRVMIVIDRLMKALATYLFLLSIPDWLSFGSASRLHNLSSTERQAQTEVGLSRKKGKKVWEKIMSHEA